MPYIITAQYNKSATSSCVLKCSYFVLWAKLAGRSVQSYDNWLFFSPFSRLDPFSQVAIKVKKWLILEVHEMIGVLHLVACPMVFNLLCGRVHQGGMLKLVKNDYFLVFLTIPPSFWVAYGVVYIRIARNDKSVSFCRIRTEFFFFDRDWQKAVFKVMKNDEVLVLLVGWVVFLTFLGRLMSELC